MKVLFTKKRYVQPTAKGQITLPVAVRTQLAIDPETLLKVSVEGSRVVLEPVVETTERWETVADFSQLSSGGVALDELHERLTQWTRSKRRSRS